MVKIRADEHTKVSLRRIRPKTAIPARIREHGKWPDFEAWHPGDVILVKSKEPDAISKLIQTVQEPGYGREFAQWTHVAVYLGDGLMLCEAQIDPPARIFSVIVSHIWDYFTEHTILLRRSKWASDKEKGWAIATAAATKIGMAYDWQFILKIAADRAFLGEDVFVRDQTGRVSAERYVCSSLYSTAHAWVTRVSITDRTNGLCIPAFLAADEEHLHTVDFDWCVIG
jgi:hypothetical protein